MGGSGVLIKRRYVRTKSLQDGMVIDQSILDRAGRVLIARGTAIDSFHKDSLLKMGISGVQIREGKADEESKKKSVKPIAAPAAQKLIDKSSVADRTMVTLSESIKERVVKGMQYLYNDPESENFTLATKIIADDLMRAIVDIGAVAVDISVLKVSDEYTFKHSVDVAMMAMIVAKRYGFDDSDMYEIGISGLLHDIGKTKIPTDILNKAGKLTDDEYELMKQHTLFGYSILKDKEDLSEQIKMGVLQHHEKMNATGYPMGVGADKINIFARIIAVVDIYDALVTERPYKKGYSPAEAIEIIMSMTEELDIEVMRCFLESVILYPVGTDVELNTGEWARVVENEPSAALRPKVVGLKTGKLYDLSEADNASIIIL